MIHRRLTSRQRRFLAETLSPGGRRVPEYHERFDLEALQFLRDMELVRGVATILPTAEGIALHRNGGTYAMPGPDKRKRRWAKNLYERIERERLERESV